MGPGRGALPQGLEIHVESGDRYEQASTYHQLGTVALEQRQWAQAEEHYRKALEIKIEFGAATNGPRPTTSWARWRRSSGSGPRPRSTTAKRWRSG